MNLASHFRRTYTDGVLREKR